MRANIRRRESQPMEMQIAPMADIGFLLLCFFIISAKPPRHEADIGMTLPGSISDEVSVDLPEEVRVAIRPDGAVEVNDATVGEAGDSKLTSLRDMLGRFREAADNNHTKSLVTLDVANQTTHQRIVDVLNACAQARIKGVTLNSDEDEGEEGSPSS